jgi:hypothetical protein
VQAGNKQAGTKLPVFTGTETAKKFTVSKSNRAIVPIQKQDVYGRVLSDEFFFYRNQLSASEKKAYDQAYANVLALDPKFTLPAALNEERFDAVICSLILDNPDIFWLTAEFGYEYDSSGRVTSCDLDFYPGITAKTIDTYKQKFDACADSVLEKTSRLGSDAEKVKYIHDFLINLNTYGEVKDGWDQSAYSAIVLGKTVCNGYSMAFTYFMQRLGIPSMVIWGDAVLAGPGGGGGHAWSAVKIDSAYYGLDITWDDPDKPGKYSYEYFNVTENVLKKEHSREELSAKLPLPNGTQYTYAALGGKPGSDFTAVKYGSPSQALPPLVVSAGNVKPVAVPSAPSQPAVPATPSPAQPSAPAAAPSAPVAQTPASPSQQATPAAPASPKENNAPASGKELTITVKNSSGSVFEEFYISTPDDDDWGDNLLSRRLRANASATFKLVPGIYDFCAVDEDENDYTKYEVRVRANTVIEFTEDDFEEYDD